MFWTRPNRTVNTIADHIPYHWSPPVYHCSTAVFEHSSESDPIMVQGYCFSECLLHKLVQWSFDPEQVLPTRIYIWEFSNVLPWVAYASRLRAQSKTTNWKRLAVAALKIYEKASGPYIRVRARAKASEASSSLPTPHSARPYPVAEDEVLQQLLARGLAWDEIEEESGPRFAEDFAVNSHTRHYWILLITSSPYTSSPIWDKRRDCLHVINLMRTRRQSTT
jgi:hypothetical protein